MKMRIDADFILEKKYGNTGQKIDVTYYRLISQYNLLYSLALHYLCVPLLERGVNE